MSLTVTIPGAVEATVGSTAPATLVLQLGVPGPAGSTGSPGQGVAAGGTTGQALVKASGYDYDTTWTTITADDKLPLAGGTMTGAIVFDGTSGQYISKGNFDTSRGGNYGISLVCSIGYEFNWQAGWLTTTNQGSTIPRPLYLDSLAGTTLRAWNSATDLGTEVTHNSIVINSDPTYDSELAGWGLGVQQSDDHTKGTTVEFDGLHAYEPGYYSSVAPTILKVFESTNELGVTIAHDSIAIQHIDTPNVTAYVTNEYIGFEDTGATPHSAFVEHDVITVQDETNTTQMHSTGVSLSAGGSITFGDATVQTTAFLGYGSPAFTGNPTAPTASPGDNDTTIATTAFVTTADNLKANLASPTFTGTVTIPSGASISGFAPLASPTFTGTPLSTTASVSTNTTQIATTAFVLGQVGTATPIVNGTATVGTSLLYARQDHVHGTDTTRAALASPTFTGTPTLPTGTIATTQSPGNNTTALATTAFVTAAVPIAATVAQALRPSSTTLSMTPDTTREMLMYPGYINLFGGGNVATSGTGASATFTFATQRWHAIRSPNTLVAGYGMYIFDYTASGIGMAAMTRGSSALGRKWNNNIWVSGRSVLGEFGETTSGLNGDSNCTARVMLGGRASVGTGGMQSTEPGIGWRVNGGGSVAIVMTVSNATTLTETTSSFTPVLGQVFDWKMYSDGTGNVTLFVNDSQVATSTGGPVLSTTENYNYYCEIVEQTVTAVTPFAMGNFGSKVFWSQV